MNVLMSAFDAGGGIRTFLRYVYGHPVYSDLHLKIVSADTSLPAFIDRQLPSGRLDVKLTSRSRVDFVRTLRREIRLYHTDLLHSHGFTAGTLSVLAQEGTGVPHLMTAHDVFTDGQFRGWKGSFRKRLLGEAFRRIHSIHTVTHEARENFTGFFPEIDPSQFVEILHGVDTEFFGQGTAYDLRGELNLSSETRLIGFFGRFMNQKGFLDLVNAMDLIVGRNMMRPLPHVVTFGRGGFIREDYAHVADRGLATYFHQATHTDRMPDALRSVDVVAMPSRWEACGLLAMEALSAGSPIVGTSCVGLNEVLQGTPAYIVPPRDAKALAEALITALQAGCKPFLEFQPIAKERFSVDRPARALKHLYQRLSID